VQPPLPGDGYLWVPGYWAWGDAGYYWVPGYWSQPPQEGLLWTPAWWGWENGAYLWHGGYWGPHVGFYGGINYGFGYGGIGFAGGEWRGHSFFYNSAVVNVGGGRVTNVYVDRNVVVHNTIVNANHVAFNGGNGGINRQPAPFERQAMNEHHVEPTSQQQQHQQFAAQDRSQLAAVNHGRPATLAAARPEAYRATAQQHVQSAPISAQDRQAGQHYTPAASTGAAPNERGPGQQPGATSRQGFNPGGNPGGNPSQGRPLNTPQPQQQRPAPQPQQRPAPQQQPHPAPQAQHAPAPHPVEHGNEHPR
jgi:hypothetical protein